MRHHSWIARMQAGNIANILRAVWRALAAVNCATLMPWRHLHISESRKTQASLTPGHRPGYPQAEPGPVIK